MKLFERLLSRDSGGSADLSQIPKLAKKYEQYVIDNRRAVHTFAEVGGQEVKTSAFIRQEAEKLGLPVEQVSATGLIVTLDTGRKGNGVVLRADIDALPVQEHPENEKCQRSVVSENPETCHACGHDAHVGMLLGAMQVLCEMKDSLCGKIYFCFEEGEEVGTGWGGMVDALEQKEVHTAFGLHVSSSLESGKVSMEPGPRMGGQIVVDATFVGKGGHGSRPDLSVNPVFAAASALNDLAVAFANQIDPNDPVTLGITSIVGGGVSNIIPDTAQVLGSMRFFSAEAGKRALQIVRRVFDHAAAMHLCKVEYAPPMSVILLPTINDAGATGIGRQAVSRVLPKDALISTQKDFGSETFSNYATRYKSVYAHIGTRNEELGTTAEHHNEHFDIDESALILGTICYAAYAAETCKNTTVSGWGFQEPPEIMVEEEETQEMPKAAVPQHQQEKPLPNAKYTLDSKIGAILKSKDAKAAVDSVVSGVVTHPQINYVKGMTIRKAASLLPNVITPEILAEIEIALSKVED